MTPGPPPTHTFPMRVLPRPGFGLLLGMGLGIALGLSACEPDLGLCYQALARTPVYDDLGVPAYEGQALIQISCGNGAFCHSAGIHPANRLAAPAGLDFDMAIATTGEEAADAATERLRRGQLNVYEHNGAIYAAVEGGTMPPWGEQTLTAHAGLPRYARADGTRLPHIDSAGGLVILRNWLACGSPVIERTTPRPDGPTTVGSVIPRGPEARPTDTFSDIFERVLSPRCGESCHHPDAPEFADAGLDLSDAAAAYGALVSAPAVGVACAAMDEQGVVPGDPDGSLLIQKLEGTGLACGDPMPLGGAPLPDDVIGAIRSWIARDAPND